MSKDNTNLRLLGSPVNLFYRSKKKDDKKNIRNRPRSALLNSNPSSPDIQERFRRPFSADAKERAHSTRSFYKSFSSELLQSYNNSNPSLVVRVLPPTTELLGDTNANLKQAVAKDKDICSNASDYGSEDTYISLGTKIKARAQLGPKGKVSNKNNHLKYRNIAKKNKKAMDNVDEEKINNDYGVEVKIIERPPSQSPTRSVDILQEQPAYPSRAYESYFIPLERNRKMDDNDLAGRVSFGKPSIQAEVEQAIDTYSRRLTLTRQQLSLVEEESTQDVTESNYSQPMSSLSPENPSEGNEKVTGNDTNRNTYVMDKEEEYPRKPNFLNDSRTYSSFYDKFRFNSMESYKPKSPSAVMYNDSSSKDSGYPDSGPNDDKAVKHNYSLPSSSLIKKSQSHDKLEEQPKSLDSVSTNSNDKNYKTYPLDRGQWAEPLNHSRLLYKDFFLKKEGHVALPPENSPINSNRPNVSSSNDVEPVAKSERNEETVDYPPYLRNSTTKAYTSQVIEDYKKELEAINNLHELTLKDIKTDTISPTPLNIDKMFENYASFDSKDESSASNSQELVNIVEVETRNKNSLEHGKTDISKVSTKELIQNYFKVKEDYGKELPNKNVKKTDRKLSNITARVDTNVFKHEWNNKNSRVSAKSPIPVSFRNITKKNAFTVTPVSARTEDVQHDKDVDSWMSMSAPSPSFLEVDIEETKDRKPDTKQQVDVIEANEAPKPVRVSPRPIPETISSQKDIAPQRELSANSTVLDIYSMLKEIESFGDNPVTSVSTANIPIAESEAKEKKEDRTITPKDNFMEIFEFLEKVEQSANDALSVVTSTVPQTIPKLEALLRLPQTELAQRLVTASLQLEERSCCIALLQESLTNHKEQMVQKVSSLEKQSLRNISKVKQECEDAIKRHQTFIDQLISDKKTLNHRIEQLVDERRALEERWRRAAQALEDRYKLELRNQHDKMAAAQQVARQRWVRQKAEKIKELTVKGLESELREMAEKQQKEISDLKMYHAEHAGRLQAKHSAELEALRRTLEEEKEAALVKERQMASARLEKQILELEGSYQAQRSRLVAEMRAENERRASGLCRREQEQRAQIEQWREEQEKIISEKRMQLEQEIAKERQILQEQMLEREKEIEKKYEQQRKEFEAEQQVLLKKKLTEISAQHKMERDREIEKAIESMEAEAQAGRRELQEALRRNKEQYEAELRELAETERATLRRQQDAQARARAAEDRCAELEVAVNQLETRNKVLTDKNNQLESQGDSIKAQCEGSWRATVDSLKKEMEDLKKIHEEQMHQLYAKVKVAVARKDSAIQALTRENSKHQEKAATLEQKLQLQRKDFLKQK